MAYNEQSGGGIKKLIIANQISLALADVWSKYNDFAGVTIFAALILYAIQLYADFSGYMDIALGCAEALGITLDENFKTPYFSKSIAEFWRNWHITLGAWFKNYLFYPLLLTTPLTKIRKKYLKTNSYLSATLPNIIALSITWLLIGLWHGASWNFILYGIYHGSFIIAGTIAEPLYSSFKRKHENLYVSKGFSLFQMLRTFVIVTFGYIIFVPATLSDTLGMTKAMTSGFNFSIFLHFVYANWWPLGVAFIGTIVLLKVDEIHFIKPTVSIRKYINSQCGFIRWIIYILALTSILIFGAYSTVSSSQFAYFRF